MPQADEKAGDLPPLPPLPHRARRASRLPWLVLGLLVTAAALATVWQRWSELGPAAPAPAEAAHPAQTEPQPPAPAGAEIEEPAQPQPQPEAVAEAEHPPAEKPVERKAYREKRVRLDVSASDRDGDPLTYAWVQTGGPSVKIHDADKPHAYFMACEPGRYVFEIRVGDGTNTTVAQVVRTVKDTDLAGRSPGKD